MNRHATLLGLSLAASFALAACGGAPTTSTGESSSGSSSVTPTAAAPAAASTTGAPASAPTPAPGDAATIPTQAPDPCTLLTEDEAFALLTTLTREEYAAQHSTSDFSSRLNPSGASGNPACEWGNASVQLSVSIIQAGSDPDLLASFHRQLLENWSGDPVAGVGDGAEITGATPVDLQAFQGYWVIDLRAYVSDTGSTPRFATAANLVLQRLAGG
jgi:hypothetical protein